MNRTVFLPKNINRERVTNRNDRRIVVPRTYSPVPVWKRTSISPTRAEYNLYKKQHYRNEHVVSYPCSSNDFFSSTRSDQWLSRLWWRYRADLKLDAPYDVLSTRHILLAFIKRISDKSLYNKTPYHAVIEYGVERTQLHCHVLLNTDVPAPDIKNLWAEHGDIYLEDLTQASDRDSAITYAVKMENVYSRIDEREGTTYVNDLVLMHHYKRFIPPNKWRC